MNNRFNIKPGIRPFCKIAVKGLIAVAVFLFATRNAPAAQTTNALDMASDPAYATYAGVTINSASIIGVPMIP
jgi:hypothetical protein